MQTDIHARWAGSDNEKHLRALRKWSKKEKRPISHYMIEATKLRMKQDGIIP